MILLLSVLCLVLAAAFKAVADTVADHFESSIFKNRDPKWWKKDESWKHVAFIRFTKYRPDAWHLAGSGMIISFVLFGIFLLLEGLQYPYLIVNISVWMIIVFIVSLCLICGLIFILVFNAFYNRILRKP